MSTLQSARPNMPLLYRSTRTISTSRRSDIPNRSAVSHALLTDLSDPEYRLREWLLLSIETDADDTIVVYESYFDIYGTGETLDEAIVEFGSMLTDYYRELTESEPVLSRHLRSQLYALRRTIARRQVAQ